MSRTSTENRRFRRALGATVAVLFVACAAFLGLGYLQGPKLSSAQVDTRGVVTQSGQQLRLFANQQLTDIAAGSVTVTPETPFTVTTTDDVIAVQFDQRLRYATDYRVTVAGVTSPYSPQASTLSYGFTTQSPELYYLDRGEPDDEIVTTGLTGAQRDVVYSARHIQDFAVLASSLAVVTLADDRTSSIDLVSLRDGVTERLLLPDVGSVAKLDVAASGTVIGFTLTSTEDGIDQINSRTLFTLDLEAGREATPVLDLAGDPLHVLGWQFVPGTSSLLALSIDRSLLLVDPTTASVTPLGQYQELDQVSADGLVATMVDGLGPVAVTLADGAEQRLSPSPVNGLDGFLGQTAVLPNGDRVEKMVVPDESGTRFSSLLVYDDGTEAQILYQTPNSSGSISDFTISPNGQYVAIETVPDAAASVSDGYAFDSRSTSVTTVIVDIATGAQARSFEGFALAW